MWFYRSSDGELTRDGEFIGTGYSGNGEGRNNPSLEHMPHVGPIPRGKYSISHPYRHPRLGPMVMNLQPLALTDTFGRDAFRIHGDNESHDASHGCIVLGPLIRGAIATSEDDGLFVV